MHLNAPLFLKLSLDRRCLIALLVALLCCLADAQQASAQKSRREPLIEGKSVREWTQELEGKELLPRIRAINALMRAGPEARTAAPMLLAVFADDEATLLHPLSVVTLARIGPDAVAPLQKALAAKDPTTRASAALILGMIGDPARKAVPALTNALSDESPTVRQAAAQSLGRLQRAARAALPVLHQALEDADPLVRIEAAAAVWRINGETRGMPRLLEILKEDNVDLASGCLTVLALMGPKAKSAAKAVQPLLTAKDAELRIVAAETLHRVTGDVAASFPVLEAESKTGNRTAIAALASMVDSEKVVRFLAALLRDDSPDVRREAACSLLDSRGELARVALERGLRDADLGVRWWSALALAQSGDRKSRFEEEILRLLRRPLFRRDEDDDAANLVLDVQFPDRAVQALQSILKTKSIRHQFEAARLLGRLGLDARNTTPELVEALRGEDKQLRRAAAEALASIGTEALPGLNRLLGDADPRCREGAARALGRMGLAARSALPGLERLLNDPMGAVRSQVALAVWSIDQNAEAALPTLNTVLKDVDQSDRWEAVEAVGIIGRESRPPIRGIMEVLATALKDRDVRVRLEAARQLWYRERQANVVVPLVRDGITERDPLARSLAIETLGELGANERAVSLLLQALDDRDVTLRLLASESLARGGEKVVPWLLDALDAKQARTSLGMLRTLELLGPAAVSARPKLEKFAPSDDAALREAVQDVLTAIGPGK